MTNVSTGLFSPNMVATRLLSKRWPDETRTVELIDRVTLTTTATSITFSDIPQTYDHLIISGAISGTSNTTTPRKHGVQFNGDSSIIYSNAGIANGSSYTSFSDAYSIMNYSDTTTGGTFEAIFLNYTSSSKQKQGYVTSARLSIGLNANLLLLATTWKNNSPITSIYISDFQSGFTSYSVGSSVAIYGVGVS